MGWKRARQYKLIREFRAPQSSIEDNPRQKKNQAFLFIPKMKFAQFSFMILNFLSLTFRLRKIVPLGTKYG
jgi:hypothetical protein